LSFYSGLRPTFFGKQRVGAGKPHLFHPLFLERFFLSRRFLGSFLPPPLKRWKVLSRIAPSIFLECFLVERRISRLGFLLFFFGFFTSVVSLNFSYYHLRKQAFGPLFRRLTPRATTSQLLAFFPARISFLV